MGEVKQSVSLAVSGVLSTSAEAAVKGADLFVLASATLAGTFIGLVESAWCHYTRIV